MRPVLLVVTLSRSVEPGGGLHLPAPSALLPRTTALPFWPQTQKEVADILHQCMLGSDHADTFMMQLGVYAYLLRKSNV